jgi:transcription antitermination factor NusG
MSLAMPKTREQIIFEHQELMRARRIGLRSIKRGYLTRIRAPHWTIVRTVVGRERFAAENIKKLGERTLILRVHDGRHGPKLKPLFPGYLFVELTGDQWMHIQYAPGVIEVLKNGGKAIRCQDDIINQLLREQGEEGYIELAPKRFMPQEGEKINIVAGLFKDHIARYIGRSPSDRMMAALDFFGKEVQFEVGRNEIAKLT